MLKPNAAPQSRQPAPLTLALVALIALLGFALRAHDLGAKSFWYDELRQIEVARLPLPFWAEALKLHSARPLDYAITRVLLDFTRSEWLLRFPALIWGTLTIPIVYRLGRRLLGEREGIIGALLFAQSSLAVSFSQELRPYGLYALTAVVSFWALDIGLRRGSRRAWILYAISVGLGVLTHYFWLVILAGQVVYVGATVALRQAPPKRLLPFGAVVGVGALVLLLTADPLVVLPLAQNYASAIVSAAAANQPPPVSLRAPGINPFAPTLTYDFFVGRLLEQLGAGGGWALVLFNGLLLLGLAGSVRARLRRGVLLAHFSGHLPFLLAWLFVGPSLIVGYLIYRNEIFAMRYILFALPAYLLLVARGVRVMADWLERLRGPSRGIGRVPVMPGLTLAALAAFTWVNVRYVENYYQTPKDDWRRIGEFLKANVRPGDAIFAPNIQSFVEYYFPDAPQYLVYEDGKREAQYTYAQHNRTWFIVSDWVTYDVTDTRRLIELYPGITFQWDASSFVKFTHRGESEADIEREAESFTIPPPSLAGSEHR